MKEDRISRFVSSGFAGVSVIDANGTGEPLLQGRSARNAALQNRPGKAKREMTRSDLIGAVAEASGLPRNKASEVVKSVFNTISEALKDGDAVRVVGFGTFSVAARQASVGRNPRTGERMKAKVIAQPEFKAGKSLRDAVN